MVIVVCCIVVFMTMTTTMALVPRGSRYLKSVPRPGNHRDARTIYERARRFGRRRRGGGTTTRNVSPSYDVAPDLSRSVSPVDYGADPTGKNDATEAVKAAMDALLNGTVGVPDMASGITNLGGAVLDLRGGVYLISAPITIPPYVGNVHIGGGGTLRASATFPTNRYLIEIGSQACTPKDGQNVCNEFVTVSDVFLDASHVCAGGIHVAMTMGTTITNSFMIGFNRAGVLVDQGHETMVSECWLAEYYWSEKHPETTCDRSVDGSGSTGVLINGEDNIVSDVIVFDFACLGVWVNGAANLLSGVHSWNGGGVAIAVNGSYDVQDRIIDCYLDYSTLEIVNPKFVLVQGNFFYNTHASLLGSHVTQLVMRENIYSMNQYGGNSSVVVTDSATCDHVTIEDEINGYQGGGGGPPILQTRVRTSIHQRNSSTFTFNFDRELVFGSINFVQYTVVYDDDQDGIAPLQHQAFQRNGTTVQVAFVGGTFSGTVFMEVGEC